MKPLLRSMKAAARGIIVCICGQRNMRIHLVAVCAVLLAAPFFSFSRSDYALAFLTFALVLAAEMGNTAIEKLVDAQTSFFSRHAGVIKDIAAGAVLVCALFAVCIAGCLFGKPEGFKRLYRCFAEHPARLFWPVLFSAVATEFIVLGPSGIKRAAFKLFSHRRRR